MQFAVVTRYGIFGARDQSEAAQIRNAVGGHVRRATKLEMTSQLGGRA